VIGTPKCSSGRLLSFRRWPGYYVTGTDTAAGKTFASVALMHALRARGLRVAGMKPVASGCELRLGAGATRTRWRCRRRAPSRCRLRAGQSLCPAGRDCAADRRRAVRRERAHRAHARRLRALAASADVGGRGRRGRLARALADGLEQGELAARLELPVILVVGMKLGCLNHARLSERRILDDGLQLAAGSANAVDPQLEFAANTLRWCGARWPTPCLGMLPHAGALRAVPLRIAFAFARS
jgi:dethiobiotin synthetase